MNRHSKRNQWLSVAATGLLLVVLFFVDRYGSDYEIRIVNNCAIFIALAVSYNLINGIAGQFSLGPNAFLAVGAYTAALLTMTPAEKELSFIIEPVIWPLSVIHLPFFVSLLAGGCVAALFAFLMGFPGFPRPGRLPRHRYARFRRGRPGRRQQHPEHHERAPGTEGDRRPTNLWWAWGFAILTVVVISRLIRSSYGLAMKAVRHDETAAEAIGIDAFRHKMLAFVVSAFFAGVGGGLLAHLITTISPSLFSFFLTFNLLIIIVLGGLGSTTGACIAAVLRHLGRRNAPGSRRAASDRFDHDPRHPRNADGPFLADSDPDHDLRAPWTDGKRGVFLERPVRKALPPERNTAMSGFFRAENLTMRFGGLTAVSGFNVALEAGEIVGLIGPNGAGKTTVFNMISGYHVPAAGRILLDGATLNGMRANRIARLGIARTFQNIRLFPDLTALENVMLAYHGRLKSSVLEAVLRAPRYRREEKVMRDGALKLLAEVGLADSAMERSASLPYGKQRKLEIARALGIGPKLLLLDEPAAGMNPSETAELLEMVLKLRRDFGLTVLLIEHDMRFVMQICERIIVLEYGITIADGTPQEIQGDERVISAYLGTGLESLDIREEEGNC